MQHTEPTSPDVYFDLSGGALCLDFANTWNNRERPETDRLRDYGDLLAFALQAGALSAAEVRELAPRARREAKERDAAFARALALRDAIHGLFHHAAAGGEPRAGGLERLNELLRQALCCLEVERRDGGYAWSWAGRDGSLEAPLWRLVHSAAELLTGGELDRVRVCASATCNWLFLDRSRNRSRRWCDMTTCGNRAKARRHYRRVRGRAAGTATR
ncbi:MAG: CGNR zinc finger domain-containing protein [Thermoanaerobaculia bacterium]